MKNKVRIIAAAVFTLFIIFSMAIPSLAADDGTITINNTNEAVSMKGHTYKAYKIFKVTYNSDTGDYDYKIADEFVNYFAAKDWADDESLGEDLDARAYSKVSEISGDADLQAFARELYNGYIATGTDAVAAAGSVKSTSATSAVIGGLAPGYYLVYDEGNPSAADNAEKAVANIALTTASPNATINLKASVPTLDKKITGVSDNASNASSATGEEIVSAKIGQHVGFQLDSNVPDLTGYTKYIYKVKDTMDAGLKPDENVKVIIGTDDITQTLLETIVDEKSCIDYNGQVTTVTIPFDILKGYAKDTPITITYSAIVATDANVYPSAEGNGNEAELEYTNNITDETLTETTPGSTVSVYLFSIDITKVNAKDEALARAKFTIKDASGKYVPVSKEGTRYKVVAATATDAATGTDATATDATATDAEAATVESDANGKIYIDGLAEGTYTITEVEAPDGYNLLKNPVTVTITPVYDDTTGKLIGVENDKIDSSDTADGVVSVKVVNKAGGLLPSTGGIGTYIFTIGGAVLMITAAFILIYRKKKAEAK